MEQKPAGTAGHPAAAAEAIKIDLQLLRQTKLDK